MAKQLIDWNSATNCSRCGGELEGASHGVGIQEGGKCEEVICWTCNNEEHIAEYKKNGEMTSTLLMTAVSAKLHLTEHGMSRLRRDCADFYTKHKDALLEIAEKNEQINKRAREWEVKHWISKLQAYYRKTTARGHSAQTKTYKALLWGCAGRVMLTLLDCYAKGNKMSKFGGAWISLIFDETSETARGGVQGYCATFDEAMGLLNAAFDDFPKMKRDDKVHMLGM